MMEEEEQWWWPDWFKMDFKRRMKGGYFGRFLFKKNCGLTKKTGFAGCPSGNSRENGLRKSTCFA